MTGDLKNAQIVEGLAAGDSKAILDRLQTVAPKWAEVSVGDRQKDHLADGYSGAVLYILESDSREKYCRYF